MQNHSCRIKHLIFFTFLFNDFPCSTIWNLAYVNLGKDASIITQSTAQQHHSQNCHQMLNLLLQGYPEERYVCLFSHSFMFLLVNRILSKKCTITSIVTSSCMSRKSFKSFSVDAHYWTARVMCPRKWHLCIVLVTINFSF
jgi:hypothetical protein